MRTYKKIRTRTRTQTRKIHKGLNVLGKPLMPCNMKKVTGYYRNGFCSTGNDNTGTHVVCAIMTDDFLKYMLKVGNNLITPRGRSFPGLVSGDRWCVCAVRWMQAYRVGKAPPVVLESTDIRAVNFIPRKILLQYGLSF